MAKTILIVENDEINQIMVESALKTAGYDTRWTDATNLAWECLQRNAYASDVGGSQVMWKPLDTGAYALVVLDVDEIRAEPYGPLLREEGLRLLRRIRADPRFTKERLPVIGTTSFLPPNAPSWRTEFLRSGGNAFFEWPFSGDDLVAKVQDLAGGP